MKHDEPDRKGVRGPMKIVYTCIIVGIVVIVATAFLTGRGPQDDVSAPVEQAD